MEMVGHEAIMEHLYHGVMDRYLADTFEDGFAEVGIANPSFSGIFTGDDQFSEQRLAGCNCEGDMVKSGAFPCFAGILPLPCIVIISHAGHFLAGDSIALEY
jgi:hypothetical protein